MADFGDVEVPIAPFDVRLVSCTARVVQLEWKHVSNDSVSVQQLQFVIEYNTSFQPHAWHVSHVSRARATLIYDTILGGNVVQLGVAASWS